MTIRISTFTGGALETNTYLVADDATREAIVVDAAADTLKPVQAALAAQDLAVRAVVLTHTHWDHIVDAAAMRSALGVPLLANAFARSRFPGGRIGAAEQGIAPFAPDGTLDEGDEVALGNHIFTVLFVPGHEPAHIALWSEADDLLISGDVLFPGGHGNTDLAGADPRVMVQTMRRLARLPVTTVVHPGHGDPTTIGAERHWMIALRS